MIYAHGLSFAMFCCGMVQISFAHVFQDHFRYMQWDKDTYDDISAKDVVILFQFHNSIV